MNARRTRTTAIRAAGAVLLVALVSACGTGLAGNAAVVGSTVVPDSQVAAEVDELRAQLVKDPTAPDFDPGAATIAIVERITRSELIAEGARREGVVVTQGQVDTIIKQTVDTNFEGDRRKLEAQLAGNQKVPASAVDQYARDFVTQSALGEKLAPGATPEAQNAAIVAYLRKVSADLDVQISPRFGSWDPQRLVMNPVPDDLSVLPGFAK